MLNIVTPNFLAQNASHSRFVSMTKEGQAG